MQQHVAHPVSDPSHPGEVRRAAVALAGQLGFSAPDAGRVGLIATEAASNIVKHAGRGVVLLRVGDDFGDRPGLELLALDRGPGMADVARSMQDGFSTAGSPGTGLGAISRLATLLDVYSAPGVGTALLARVLPQSTRATPAATGFTTGVVSVPKPGETACGDGWSRATGARGARFLVADGLGHGASAAVAARAAEGPFLANASSPLPDVFLAMHGTLLPTRGAAASVAEIDLAAAEVHYAGVGNVGALIAWPGGSRRLVGQNGTLGVQLVRLRVATYPWPDRAALVLHSDGLNSHTAPDGYPGLLAHHPTVIAAVLYRDFSRGTDDATVLVATRTGAP